MRRLLGSTVALLLVLSGVVLLASSASAAPVEFAVVADGGQEVPGPGDDDGLALADIAVDDGTDELCYSVVAFDITLPPAGMHIHEGPAGVAGPIVVPLDPSVVESGDQACQTIDPALADDITANPANYYLNIHTTDFPDGAVRGQLGPVPELVVLEANGDGAQEVPGPGDPDGTVAAFFALFEEAGALCSFVTVDGVTLPAVGLHIHEAPVGVAGPIVITLDPASIDVDEPSCVDADPAVLADIAANPANYYLNVHTPDFPDGAVRGQLAVGDTFEPITSTTEAPATTAALPRAVPAGSGGQAAADPGSNWLAVVLIAAGGGVALLSAAAWRRRDGQVGSA